MTVATLNPFDLLNEDIVVPKSKKTVTIKGEPTVVLVSSNDKQKTPNKNKNNKNNTYASNKAVEVTELNANVPMPEKSSIRRTPASSRTSTTNVNSNERQERRKTDRHSRSGYKQDGEKRMNGGKGSWGKAVVSSEQNVSVVESVAIAEGEIVEVESNDEGSVVVTEQPVTTPQIALTLAQYQATLKKSVQPANVTRKLSPSSVPTGEILKKESEVFVFPEIVKKSVAHVPAVKKVSNKKTEIDVSKYISVKTVGSLDNNGNVEQKRPEKEKENRNERERSSRTEQRSRNSRTSTTSTPAASSSKLNLKDDRSFPSLGSK